MVQLALREVGTGVTVAAAAVTFTTTGMAMDTPVPVNAIEPEYVPAVRKDAVLNAMNKLAGLDWLTLKLLAESPIHDWLATAVSETADADVVLT